MASTWNLTVNGESYEVVEADLPALRTALLDAVSGTPAWITVRLATDRAITVEFLITPTSQVLLQSKAPQRTGHETAFGLP